MLILLQKICSACKLFVPWEFIHTWSDYVISAPEILLFFHMTPGANNCANFREFLYDTKCVHSDIHAFLPQSGPTQTSIYFKHTRLSQKAAVSEFDTHTNLNKTNSLLLPVHNQLHVSIHKFTHKTLV